ncbi:putative ABC transporter FUM19 [Seiridium cardinale]
MSNLCSASLDDVWGPAVDGCRRSMDFTLLFEQSVLSIVPSSAALLLSLLRLYQLFDAKTRVQGKILPIALFALNLSLTVLWSRNQASRTRASIPATIVALLLNILLLPLSWLEHSKTIRPSPLICAYLIVSSLVDLAQVRTLWLIQELGAEAAVFSAIFAVRVGILGFECTPKTRFLVHAEDIARSPEDKCGIISRSFFLWLLKLIWNGFRGTIMMDDLYEPPVDTAPEGLEARLQKYWDEEPKNGKSRLLRVTARAIRARLLAPVIPRICMVGFVITQPLLLLAVIEFLNEAPESSNYGYGLIGAYAIVYIGVAVSNAWYFHQTFKFIAAVRSGLIAMVYSKAMRLNLSATDKGSAVTVMSSDIERIVMGLRSVHDIWANVIQVALAAWLLERQTGVAIVAPVVVAAACGYGTLKVSEAAGGQQVDWLAKIETRIDTTTRTLSSMRGVKLSGLAGKLIDKIQDLRHAELHSAGKYRWWEIGAMVMGFFPVMISPVLTFAIYIGATNASSQPLDAARMFVSLSFLTLMSQPLSMLFQSGPEIMSMVACFGRIGDFLATEQWSNPKPPASSSASDSSTLDVSGQIEENEKKAYKRVNSEIRIVGGRFGWKDTQSVLDNVNVVFPQGKLSFIIGPVGCGKSTLLKGILGEVQFSSGMMDAPLNSVSFCDQSPWIINGTLKENVVMFSAEDENYYRSVIHGCALTEDLARMHDGDESNLGSGGITLSGGQKQRLSLARAVFARRNINLFDDILSGLDAITAMAVFARVFGPAGLLRQDGKTIVLATHAVHLLPYADHIVCLGIGGEVTQQGTFDELQNMEGYVRQLNISNNPTLPPQAPVPQTPVPSAAVSSSVQTTMLSSTPDVAATTEKPKGVYRYYVKAIGRGMAVVYVVLALAYGFLYTFPYIWAKWWTDANATDPSTGQDAYYMGIYALLQVLCLTVLTIFAWHAVVTIITASGLVLHQTLLTTALHAPLAFFERTDLGVTLNRFSQDLQMVDNELPMAALEVACSAVVVTGQLLLIMNTSYWVALSFPLIFGVLWALQKIYLRTSRQLRHLELNSKAPLYTQFVESIEGLATIRAFGWQEQFKILNYERLNMSQRPFYLKLCVQRWLNVVLDCQDAGFVVLLVGLIVGLRSRISPGFAGVALSSVLNLSIGMTNLVKVWTEGETSIASIQRIRDFERDTPSEINPAQHQDVPQGWPEKGAISIRNLSVAYGEGKTTALKGINMRIKPGEKIGVCGRTGSGKTSLMLSLFRMIDITEGSIEIDGISIASVSPSQVRHRLNAVPQEAFFLNDTIRVNADPHGICTDDAILQALQKVHLKTIVQRNGGLDGFVDNGTFSHGEKQLFCLARAILKQSKVVVLDEATSNIDVEMEKLIHQVILEEFKDFTVITIAHRLDAILSSDRVALLDKGEIVEFAAPEELLSKDSHFKALYNTYNAE